MDDVVEDDTDDDAVEEVEGRLVLRPEARQGLLGLFGRLLPQVAAAHARAGVDEDGHPPAAGGRGCRVVG